MADDAESTTESVEEQGSADAEAADEATAEAGAEPTDVIEKAKANAPTQPSTPVPQERRFTAPSAFDAGVTEQIKKPPDPPTEVIPTDSPAAPTEPILPTLDAPAPATPPKQAAPQAIPPRPRRNRSWGWVLALILVIAALAAVAILGTVALTRKSAPQVSKEDQVRNTIQNFDIAVQKGDLPSLRGITCGTTRDNYVGYDDRAWADTYARISAAKQYPVVASIDQVIVNDDHAEANVTTFMAYDPQIRSTRSFDLQYRDQQWKICQVPG